ncbi:MAG TPA: efflux RND transporter periplasmic adaptor subunit, partial [Gammaproteobacteria bacterium]|nr:efflux RND transporter periplasmic adaptor subunit [Gammaproteobacteria bacterium]
MIKRFILVILVLAAVFGGIFAYKYQQMQKMAAEMEKPRPPATVASAVVQKEDWTPYLNAVGSLVASQGVDVTTEVPGQVSAIRFRSGQAVEEGEPIVQLDDSVDRADLQGLVAERRLAEVQFERMSRLYKQQSVSKSDYDEARAKLDAARARVTAKRAVIRKKAIRAPFAGRLGIRKVDLGEYLEPGTAVVGLQALDPIHVDYSLPEHHFA